jgi:glycosyltransferase involved in cell wall biosynthesis
VKVLHVIPTVAARHGGPSVAIRAMTRALAAQGAEVTVATTDADGVRSRLPLPRDGRVVEAGVTYRYFPRTLPGFWYFSWPLTRWLWREVSSFDVVHVHALFSYPSIPACRLACRAGVPYVLRPLGTLDPWSLGHRGWKKRPYYALIERTHVARANAIHVTSESERAAVAALGFGALARNIPLGVDVSDAAVRARRDTNVVRLLFLSRLHPKKGIPLLLEAVSLRLAAGERLELMIAGSGAPEYEDELRALAGRLGVAHVVRFVGHVEGEAKRALLADADLFVLPSKQENFGIAVAEALAAGLPVIVSDQVGIADDVRAARAGLVVPLTADALATAIGELGADAPRRVEMSASALRLARDSYSWERTAAGILALYAELTERARGARRGALSLAGAN